MGPFPDVREVLPHREPLLLIERVVELNDRRVVAVRTFRADEPFFAGHFPGQPVVPGVYLVEGIAQTMAYYALLHRKAPRVFLVGIDRARFRSIVEPGVEVRFEVDVGDERFGMLTGRGKAMCAGKKVADASVTGYAGEAPK